MYNEVHDKVLEAIMTVALKQIMYEEDEACPSDEKLTKMYPTSKKMMRKYRNKVKERWYRNPLPVVYLKRVSIIVLAVISVMFGVLTTSGEVRAAIADTVVTWYDKYVRIDFSNVQEVPETDITNDKQEPVNFLDLIIGYVPDKFELVSSTEESYMREYIYTAENGDYMVIAISPSETGEALSDIEYSKYEELTINNNQSYILYNESERTGSLITGNKEYIIWISSICEKTELIKVAESIK